MQGTSIDGNGNNSLGSQVGLHLFGTSAPVSHVGVFNVHIHILMSFRGNKVSLQLFSPQIFGFLTTTLTNTENRSLNLN